MFKKIFGGVVATAVVFASFFAVAEDKYPEVDEDGAIVHEQSKEDSLHNQDSEEGIVNWVKKKYAMFLLELDSYMETLEEEEESTPTSTEPPKEPTS